MPSLVENPLHLGLGATAVPQPLFTGMDWYQGYGERNGHDGAEGRLVTMYRFTTSWNSWECTLWATRWCFAFRGK